MYSYVTMSLSHLIKWTSTEQLERKFGVELMKKLTNWLAECSITQEHLHVLTKVREFMKDES